MSKKIKKQIPRREESKISEESNEEKKSSSGSFGFLTLLLAPLALIGRRRKRK